VKPRDLNRPPLPPHLVKHDIRELANMGLRPRDIQGELREHNLQPQQIRDSLSGHLLGGGHG
jgi:hypothetical protein